MAKVRGEKREEKGRFMPSPWIVTDNNAVPRISTRPSIQPSPPIVAIVLSRPF